MHFTFLFLSFFFFFLRQNGYKKQRKGIEMGVGKYEKEKKQERENKLIMKSKMIISKIEDYHFFLIEEKYHEYY